MKAKDAETAMAQKRYESDTRSFFNVSIDIESMLQGKEYDREALYNVFQEAGFAADNIQSIMDETAYSLSELYGELGGRRGESSTYRLYTANNAVNTCANMIRALQESLLECSTLYDEVQAERVEAPAASSIAPSKDYTGGEEAHDKQNFRELERSAVTTGLAPLLFLSRFDRDPEHMIHECINTAHTLLYDILLNLKLGNDASLNDEITDISSRMHDLANMATWFINLAKWAVLKAGQKEPLAEWSKTLEGAASMMGMIADKVLRDNDKTLQFEAVGITAVIVKVRAMLQEVYHGAEDYDFKHQQE